MVYPKQEKRGECEGGNQEAFGACFRSSKPYKHGKMSLMAVHRDPEGQDPIMRFLSLARSNPLRPPMFYKNLHCASIVADVSNRQLDRGGWGRQTSTCCSNLACELLWRSFLLQERPGIQDKTCPETNKKHFGAWNNYDVVDEVVRWWADEHRMTHQIIRMALVIGVGQLITLMPYPKKNRFETYSPAVLSILSVRWYTNKHEHTRPVICLPISNIQSESRQALKHRIWWLRSLKWRKAVFQNFMVSWSGPQLHSFSFFTFYGRSCLIVGSWHLASIGIQTGESCYTWWTTS